MLSVIDAWSETPGDLRFIGDGVTNPDLSEFIKEGS
jgi:hypothetical protein